MMVWKMTFLLIWLMLCSMLIFRGVNNNNNNNNNKYKNVCFNHRRKPFLSPTARIRIAASSQGYRTRKAWRSSAVPCEEIQREWMRHVSFFGGAWVTKFKKRWWLLSGSSFDLIWEWWWFFFYSRFYCILCTASPRLTGNQKKSDSVLLLAWFWAIVMSVS